MKRIIAAAGVAAIVVGLPTAAWGQAPDPEQVQESGTDVLTTAGCPISGHADHPGPVAEYCEGTEAVDPSQEGGAEYLCSVGKAVADGFEANGGAAVAEQINTLRSAGGCKDPAPTTTTSSIPPTTTTIKNGGGGGGGGPSGGPGDEVLSNNAGADGALPRTGADTLIAGGGMGLAGVAGLLRRFLGR